MIWLFIFSALVFFKACGDAFMFDESKTIGKRYLAATTLLWLITILTTSAGVLKIQGGWYDYLFTLLSYVGLRYFAFDGVWNYIVFRKLTMYIGVTGDYAKLLNKVPGVIIAMTKLMAGLSAITYLIYYQ